MSFDTKRKPYSILMSEAERHHIARKAAPLGITVPEFMRLSSLNQDITKALAIKDKKQADREAAALLMTALARSNIPSNLNQIAKAIHTGTLTFSIDTDKQLLEACSMVREIRNTLIIRQGLKS